MPRLTNKSFTARAPQTGGSIPELPDFSPEIAEVDGGRTNAALQRWWDLVRQRIEFNNGSVDRRMQEYTRTIDGITGSITVLQEITSDVEDYLESRYTISVTAGAVVTGMTIFSATGPDTEISEVAFQADRFKINTSGGGNKQLFSATASAVKLGDVLTVDLVNAKVFIGTGTYGNANTAFYVDDDGYFSLKGKLTFDPTSSTLTIDGSGTFTGTITATAGEIGGWTIAATTISKNNAVLDSAGQLILGTSNDIVYISATDATYRLWVGNVTAGSATFRVSKTGVLTASNGVFSGAVTSDSGTIAGFTLNATGFTTGSGSSFVQIQSTGATIQFGNGTNQVAVYSAQGLAITNTGGVGTLAAFLGTSGGVNLLRVYNNSSVIQFDFSGTTGALTITGTMTANLFSGSGASLTTLNASNVSSGTLDNARLPSAISVTTVDASADISANELNIVGTEVINNSLELVSLGLVLNAGSGVKCDLKFDDHAGADSAFANYMKINGNGGTIYVPYRSSAP